MQYNIAFSCIATATWCALTSSALATNGVVAIWGTNNYGQSTVPNWLGSCSQISAGTTHTLAVDANGVIKAWGNNSFGQCTVPYFQYSIVQIAAGDGHSMALQSQIPTSSSTNVKCWGNNSFGQSTIPGSLGNTIKIAAGFYHSLAIKNTGTVYAWGDNRWNQSTVPTSPTGAPLLGTCSEIACGFAHSLAIQYPSGTVKAWGAGTTNTGTNPEFGQSIVPSNLGACTQVAAGALFSVALKANGSVVTWGNTWASVPTNLGACTAIAAGNSHAVAIQTGGNIVAWGDNTYGQCNVVNNGAGLRISANTYDTAAIQTDPCDADGNGTPNYSEAGAATSTWLFPNITSTFENQSNWSAGIPGYATAAKISGNPQITFDCSNSVKTLELSTSSINWYPGMSLNLNSHSLTVHGGRIAFAPGAGSYMPYSVNVSGGYVYNGSANDTLPLVLESDHATWNINYTSIYSNRIELATLDSNSIELDLSSSNLYTHSVMAAAATGGIHHIQLFNSSIVNFNEVDTLVIGSDIWVSLKGSMDGDQDYSYNTIGSWSESGTVFQPRSFLDAWGNLAFTGSVNFGGQIDLHTFPSAYNGRTNILVQGTTFTYGANTSATPYAVMNVFGKNFNDPTCTDPTCGTPEVALINLQLNVDGLASIAGPLFIHSADGTIPAEGNVYTLISLDPTYSGAFDPNNNKFSSVRWVGQNGDGLPNGLTFEQVLTEGKLQLHCVRATIVEPAPSTTTNLANVPLASASADFTSDGRDDVVNLIVGSSNSVQIMKDMGDGTFAQLRTFALPSGATPNAIAAGNVVGDNAPEIAVTSILNGAGFVTLYSATGGVIWTRQLASGELPTCVCMLEPSATGGGLGQVSVGIEKTSALNPENAFAGSSGSLKNIGGTNATTSDIPLSGVPRTVRGTDVNGDDFGDTTVVGTTATSALADSTLGFIQQVTMTTNGPQAGIPRVLSYIPVSLAIADIDGDGVKDIFAACNSIPSTIPDSTRPVACFLRGSVSPTNGLYSMSAPTGISVGRPVQGKAVAIVQRNGGFSLAVASNDGINDSVDVLQLNTFANGGITVGAQTQISTGGSVIGLHTLLDQGTQKFATVRNVNSPSALKNGRASKIATMRGENEFTSGAVIESTGYVELLYGDINKDGVINSADLGTLLSQYGLPGIADLNSDGTTNSADLGILLGLL